MPSEPSVIVTDEELFHNYAKAEEEKFSLTQAAKEFVQEECHSLCTSAKAKRIVTSVLPITKWVPEYKVSRDLLNDIAAGITVGVVHLPQGLAYALLAQLPPVHGLYTSLFPVLVYSLFGTTRHLSVGTFAVVALMVGEAISRNGGSCPSDGQYTTTPAPSQNFTLSDNTTESTSVAPLLCSASATNRSVEIAVALCIAVAIIHFGMYVFRLGILYVYLSSHMVSGFTCGAAFHVFTSQVSSLFGIRIERKTGVFSIVYTYIDLFRDISSISWATVIVSLCNCVFLIIGKEVNRKYSKKLPFPIPWELGVVVFSTLASTFGYLNANYGVRVVGEIPQGIQTSIPNAHDIGLVFSDAIPISIVTFSISISLSLLFSEKHAYNVDANQELLAYSIGNIVGSFFQCFPCAASLSRSLVWEQSGGKTQLTGIVSSVLVVVTLLWIGPLFQQLPNAALAAIIMVNLKNLLKQFNKVPSLWRVSKIDAITWVVTWASTTFLGVDIGLYVGVAFSLFTVVLRTQLTFGDVMVAVGHESIYRSAKRFDGKSDADIVVFKFPSPLIYANQIRFKQQLTVALRFKPQFEVALRKIAKERADRRKTKTFKSVTKNRAENADTSMVIENPHHAEISPSTSTAEVNMDRFTANGIKMPLFLILDMSICSFIDNDGVVLLKSLLSTLSELKIRLLLARCTADVRRCLLNGKFPNTKDDKPLFFVSLDKAVAYAKQRKASFIGLQTPLVDEFTPTRESLRSSLRISSPGRSSQQSGSSAVERASNDGRSTPDVDPVDENSHEVANPDRSSQRSGSSAADRASNGRSTTEVDSVDQNANKFKFSKAKKKANNKYSIKKLKKKLNAVDVETSSKSNSQKDPSIESTNL